MICTTRHTNASPDSGEYTECRHRRLPSNHRPFRHRLVGYRYRLRWIWFTGKVPFAGSAAATLLLIGTLAAVLAVESGEDGHGPAERIPGARPAVEEHEEWGERTRNLFLELMENFPDDQRIKDRLAQFR